MLNFFKEVKDSLKSLSAAQSDFAVWELKVNQELEEIKHELSTFKTKLAEAKRKINELNTKAENSKQVPVISDKSTYFMD